MRSDGKDQGDATEPPGAGSGERGERSCITECWPPLGFERVQDSTGWRRLVATATLRHVVCR